MKCMYIRVTHRNGTTGNAGRKCRLISWYPCLACKSDRLRDAEQGNSGCIRRVSSRQVSWGSLEVGREVGVSSSKRLGSSWQWCHQTGFHSNERYSKSVRFISTQQMHYSESHATLQRRTSHSNCESDYQQSTLEWLAVLASARQPRYLSILKNCLSGIHLPIVVVNEWVWVMAME